MRIAVFAENRNAVQLTARLLAAPKAGGHTFHLVTADVDGQVGTWVADEAARRLPDLEPVNLFAPGEAIGEVDFPHELGERVTAYVAEHGIERVVLFNDQSRRGNRVATALRGTVPVVLVQDGHLDFRYRDRGLAERDRNWHYGATRPAAVCVWGPATQRNLLYRSWSGPGEVVVTGALGHSEDAALLRAVRGGVHRRGAEPGTPLRTVILDQPLGAQGKLSADEHRAELTALVEALRPYGDVEIKPHPSSPPGHIAWLAGLGVTVHDAATLLEAGALSAFDLAVTFFSTTYLQTLRSGTPLVCYGPTSLNIVFPGIRHPLIRSAGTVREVADIALRLKVEARFRGNPTGEPVEHYLRFHSDVAGEILEVVERAAVPPEAVREPVPAAVSAPSGTLAGRALAEITERVRRPRSLAVLGTDFSYVTGMAIPVLTYTQHLVSRGPVDVRYLDIWAFSDPGDVLRAIDGFDHVLVNSLSFFWRNWLGHHVVRRLLEARVPVTVYAHETEFLFQRSAVTYGKRHEEMLRLLPRVRVLCVSKAQADFFRTLGVRDPAVVYNTVPVDHSARRARPVDPSAPRIAMVGSVQERKGAELFSRVADRAAALGLPWRFAWYGHNGMVGGPALSENVEWAGARPRGYVRERLADADVLFLSSVDDPMPLAVLEAVQQRLRVVTYDRVGSKEILQGVSGYRGFGEYTPGAAVDAIRAVLADDVDEDAYAEVAELFSVENFSARMSAALDLARLGEAPSAPAPTVAPLAEQTPQVRRERFAELRAAGRHDDALLYGRALHRDHPSPDLDAALAELAAATTTRSDT